MLETVSVVIPCYNSADTLEKAVEEVEAALSPRYRVEFVLVNDGSADGTWACIEKLHQRFERVIGIQHMRNFGEHSAVMTGLRHVTGDAAVIIDDDGQHPPDAILALLAALEGDDCDVVFGSYEQKQHALWRNLGSWLNGVVGNLVLKKPRDIYLSSFKAIRRQIVDELVKYTGPYVYVDGLLFWLTDRCKQIQVRHRERQGGRSNYNMHRLLSLHLNLVTGFSILPLRLASIMGFMLALVGMIMAVVVVIEKLTDPTLQVGWASQIVAVLLIGGIQLGMLGVVGEYTGRIFLMINRKPQSVIRSVIR